MTSPAAASSGETGHAGANNPAETTVVSYESGDAREVFARLGRGLTATLGLAALGMVAGIFIFLATGSFRSATTSMRVSFGFKSFGKGEYPDHSKFMPDDL